MKIALVYPRWNWIEYNGLAEPLGLLQLVSALRSGGHDVTFLDYSFCRSLDELDEMVKGAGMIGVAVSSAATLGSAATVTAHLHTVNPDAVFLAGGAYPSIFPEHTLNEIPVDYVLVGEAEESILELADSLETGADTSSILNLVFRDRSGDVVANSRRPVPSNLDELSFPARDVVDYDAYLQNGMYEFGVITSRGCPFNCLYCKPSTDRIFGGGIRFRSPQNVVEELTELARLRGTNSLPVFFKDDTITLHPTEWFEEFRDRLSSNDLKLKWHCATRVDTVSRSKLKVMACSGCHCISYGVESGSQRILDFYRKGTTPAQAALAFQWSREFGIEATAMLMIGCPMEKEEDLEATYSLLRKLKPDDIVVYFSTAIPGRDIHDWAEKKGYLINDANPELFDPARNRALEVMNMRLPYLQIEDVVHWKHRIERYRSWRKVTSIDNIRKWLTDLVHDPATGARNARLVLKGFSGSRDRPNE
ncbi:MAG: B12-binding domain-containing radical SAM protein [Candidatus Aegiribacteria sp.]|nr:B12-binding domain-containing radical SAM protein [Candidatus Aegiribacteria sp.]